MASKSEDKGKDITKSELKKKENVKSTTSKKTTAKDEADKTKKKEVTKVETKKTSTKSKTTSKTSTKTKKSGSSKEETATDKNEKKDVPSTSKKRSTNSKKKKKQQKKKKGKKKQKKGISKLTIFLGFIDLCAIICFFIMYGPIGYIRNLFVTTAMNTMEHQWLAKIFYSDEKISAIMNQNYFVAITENANVDDIVINTDEKTTYENEYEEELLTRDEGNDLYKVINLKVGSSDAYLIAIYDPTKVELIHTQKFNVGGYGERVITMCERYGGVVCINGGGFVDNGMGSDIPEGYVIKNHEIIWVPEGEDEDTYTANIIGLTDEGKLMLMADATGTEAVEAGIKDGMVFGPFLIVNGKALEIVGDPWGKSPRVAIAQTKDGVLMFLVVDGKNYIDGASLQDMVDVLLLYGAYNAANLDGGQSSSLVVEGVLMNNPPSEAKSTNGRYVVTGWGLIP